MHVIRAIEQSVIIDISRYFVSKCMIPRPVYPVVIIARL